MDEFWQRCIEEEPVLPDGAYPDALDMDTGNLVKFWQSFDAPVTVLLTYPTKKTTKHPHYGCIRDITNESIAMMLRKLGYYDTSPPIRDKPILLINLFPRRIDRTEFDPPKMTAEVLFKQLPQELVQYWRMVAFEMLGRSRSKIFILFGNTAQRAYLEYVCINRIRLEAVTVPGYFDPFDPHSFTLRHWAYLEMNKDRSIHRLIVCASHPEAYMSCSTASTDLSKNAHIQLIRERLLDLVNIIAHGQATLLGLLVHAMNYYVSLPAELVIPRSLFHVDKRDELAALLKQTYFNSKLHAWVKKRGLPMTPDEIVTINKRDRPPKKRWIATLNKRNTAGDANAQSLLLMLQAERDSRFCEPCDNTIKAGRRDALGKNICERCWVKTPKLCCRCNKTKPGTFYRDKENGQDENAIACEECLKEPFLCSKCKRMVFEKPVRRDNNVCYN
jgi:hypothetical protein